MAVNKNNPVVEGASGRFGRTMVFRQKGALTVMAVRPKPTNKLPTQEQMRQRFLFAEASAYAMDAINDPVTKEAYLAKAKGNQTAYNVAFKDFLTPPVLHLVDWSKYTGAIGDTITCRITDIMAVVSVKVSLYGTNDELIEEGMAVQSSLKLDWVYTATTAHAPVAGTRMVVQMTDTPQNVYTQEQLME
ncbi:hypothetical protein [Pedobacter sp.]|uniref:hypothetical protein n=1 Tax=Pedobacter sp. TaxID=1411316 RepID=UPI00396CF1AC